MNGVGDSDRLRTMALARLQEDLRQVHREAERHEARLGRPPGELIVEEKEPSPGRPFNTGRSVSRWRVGLDSIVAVPIESSVPTPTASGMYWDVGRGDFAALANGGLRIGWFVGPRYGRGFDYPVIDQDGEPRLGDRVSVWAS